MIASLAEGPSKIVNYSTGADCHSTLGCVRALGIDVEEQGTTVTIQGRGLHGWKQPAGDLDAGNSGSTIRMMSGLLAAQPFDSRIFGDESLSRRPMGRVIKPLESMGAHIEARENQFPPLCIRGTRLHAIDSLCPARRSKRAYCSAACSPRAQQLCVKQFAPAITPRSPCANSAPICRLSSA
jgi:3-phosphoshikimate 1-carboxyvinyltransferase